MTHPTSLIRCSCLCLLRALTIASGLHSDRVQVGSVRTVSGLLRTLVNAGTSGTYINKGVFTAESLKFLLFGSSTFVLFIPVSQKGSKTPSISGNRLDFIETVPIFDFQNVQKSGLPCILRWFRNSFFIIFS